jgi:hypothetical protein
VWLLDYLTSGRILWRWAFVVWAILSLLWTTRGRLSVDRAITLVEIQVVGLVFYDAARNLGLSRWILNTVFVCAVIAAVHAMATEDPTVVQRLAGLYASPNTLGMFCVIGLAVFMSGIARLGNAAARIGAYASAFILLIGIVASSSLKGVMGLVSVCVLGAALSASRARVAVFVGVAAGLGAALVAFVEPVRFIWEHALYRLETALTTIGMSVGVNQSTVERARFIKKGLSLIAEAPVFGRGLDTFRWLSGEGTYAHNNMVELGVALGLVGVVLYYGFHLSILRAAVRLRRTDDFVWRFIVIAVPTLLLLDIAVVSYTSKLPTLLLITPAPDARFPRLGSSPLEGRQALSGPRPAVGVEGAPVGWRCRSRGPADAGTGRPPLSCARASALLRRERARPHAGRGRVRTWRQPRDVPPSRETGSDPPCGLAHL